MRRTDRLFEIIQLLRTQKSTITAEQIADQLEVSVRTIYRDIQALQAMRTPIEGEAGVGYMMRPGYDLPPINFSNSEIEAIVVGLNLIGTTGDQGLHKAAMGVLNKLESTRERLGSLKTSTWKPSRSSTIDPELLRKAIRNEQKVYLTYRDESGSETQRKVQPIAMIYYVTAIVMVAWCELRRDFRHFRVDRMLDCQTGCGEFKQKGDGLRQSWEEQYEEISDVS